MSFVSIGEIQKANVLLEKRSRDIGKMDAAKTVSSYRVYFSAHTGFLFQLIQDVFLAHTGCLF